MINTLPSDFARDLADTVCLRPEASRRHVVAERGPQDGDFAEVRVGSELDGHHVVETLAEGGMGAVFKVRDRDGRELALKAPLREGRGGTYSHRMKRFLRETRLAARMNHPGVAKVVEVGQEDGLPYYTMELVDGAPLSDRMWAGPLPVIDAVRIAEAAARAAHHIHQNGVVHRDLKPQNILVRPSGEVVIIDLGLARDTAGFDPRITQDGTWLGTPAYISPEQARGEASTVDARTDVYSLGAVLYEALTGFAPFGTGNPVKVFTALRSQRAALVRASRPDCPASVERVVMKAIAKDKHDRFATALEFAEALAAAVSGLDARPAVSAPVAAPARPVKARSASSEARRTASRLRRLAPSREQTKSLLALGTPALLALAGVLLLLL